MLPKLDAYHPRLIDDTTLEIRLQNSQSLNILFNDLSTLGLNIKSMRNKTNRLEELFIDLIEDNKSSSSTSEA
jgi:ABC-2 type transport system ATP-binding protein